jgi:hypothetical protein
VVGRLRHLDHVADVGDGLALGNQLLCRSLLRRSLRLELADDLLGCVPGAFHGRVPGLAWPDGDLFHTGVISGVHVKPPTQLALGRDSNVHYVKQTSEALNELALAQLPNERQAKSDSHDQETDIHAPCFGNGGTLVFL